MYILVRPADYNTKFTKSGNRCKIDHIWVIIIIYKKGKTQEQTMIRSMTGYGRAELANDDMKITVEIKSVNNRYLDIGIKMPRQLGMLEA